MNVLIEGEEDGNIEAVIAFGYLLVTNFGKFDSDVLGL